MKPKGQLGTVSLQSLEEPVDLSEGFPPPPVPLGSRGVGISTLQWPSVGRYARIKSRGDTAHLSLLALPLFIGVESLYTVVATSVRRHGPRKHQSLTCRTSTCYRSQGSKSSTRRTFAILA